MSSRILNENLLDLDILANNDVSSEQAAFPVTNAYNLQRRSKVWRSNGYWLIESPDNTLVFRETMGGPDLTATIPATEYGSDTALFTAIKTAMEAVSVDTFTVTRDTSTKKINIASSGSYFELRTATTFMNIIGYLNSSPRTGATSYLAEAVRIHTSEWILWDFGISTNPQALVIIGKRNSPIGITPAATIKLQGNETDNWSSPTYETTIDQNDEVIAVFKADGDDGLHTEALRFWRLEIIDVSNPAGYVEIGAMFLGNMFEPERGRIQFPFAGQYIDRSTNAFSEGGQTFSDRREQSEQFSIQWSGLTTADKENMDQIFSVFGIHSPMFIQFDPDLAFSSEEHKYIRYVKFDSAPQYNLERPNFWTMGMELREEL